MGLYRLSQTINDEFDTYDSCVVCARSLETARIIHPRSYDPDFRYTWVNPEDVEVEYLGEETSGIKYGTVICASFNAG